jgi:hypothetical protein
MMLGLSHPDERIVAVLHDVCEDCPGWTFDRLRGEGFSDHIITALDAVTKREGEDYEDFGKYPPAEPGALGIGPLEAAVRVADATLHSLAT